MSFQFNFDIKDTENSPIGCESSSSSSDFTNNGQSCNSNTFILEDREAQQKKTNETEELCPTSLSKSKEEISHDPEQKTLCCKPAIEHTIPQDVTAVLENKIIETCFGLQFVNVSVVEMTLSDSDMNDENIVSKTVKSNSDLISGVYEGGMKIWECTFDLIRYFEDEDIDFKGKKVLDLGCGAGLLGIVALKRKAKEVHFQDYNSTVIEEITIPNILVNCDSDDLTENSEGNPSRKKIKKSENMAGFQSKCRFFSGDWLRFRQFLQNEIVPVQYDVIVTSETIYNPAYYSILHNLFQNVLVKDGVVYVASKSHYFGVGGGVHLFETFVKEAKLFHIKTLSVYDDGLQRILLSLSFKKCV